MKWEVIIQYVEPSSQHRFVVLCGCSGEGKVDRKTILAGQKCSVSRLLIRIVILAKSPWDGCQQVTHYFEVRSHDI